MKPKDYFGIVIRTIGVLMLFVSGLYLYSAFVALIAPETPRASTPTRYLLVFAVTLVIALYFLRGAPQLMRFAYLDDTKDSNDEPGDA